MTWIELAAEGTDGVLTAEGEVVARHAPDDGTGRPPGIGISLEQTGPAWAKLYQWLTEPTSDPAMNLPDDSDEDTSGSEE